MHTQARVLPGVGFRREGLVCVTGLLSSHSSLMRGVVGEMHTHGCVRQQDPPLLAADAVTKKAAAISGCQGNATWAFFRV